MNRRRPTLRSMLVVGAVALGLAAAVPAVADAAPVLTSGVTAGSVPGPPGLLDGTVAAPPWSPCQRSPHRCTQPVLWP